MSASHIYALIDEVILDLANIPTPYNYCKQFKFKQENRKNHKKQKLNGSKNKEIRTSISHPLDIDWLLPNYQFINKLPNGKKFKFVNCKTNFDINTSISIDFKIGMTMCPGKCGNRAHFVWNRDMYMDLDQLKQYNVDIIVTLLSKKDIIRLNIQSMFDEINKRGMESIWYDMPDGSIPKNVKKWKQYVSYIASQLTKQNKSVVVHCQGGLGRTGAFVLSVLKYLKLINDQTIGQGVVWIGNSRKSAGGTATQIKFVQSLQF
eukprot:242724_1